MARYAFAGSALRYAWARCAFSCVKLHRSKGEALKQVSTGPATGQMVVVIEERAF